MSKLVIWCSHSSSFALWLKAAWLTGLVMLMQQTSLAPATAQTVSYSTDPQVVVASYTQAVGELEDADPGPSVRIYGDGRAEVHRPRYMKNAGDFKVQLSKAEMDGLISALVANGLLEFDPAAVQQAKRDALADRGGAAAAVLEETTDPSITTIELRIRRNSSRTGGGAAGTTDVSKTVKWVGLEADAERFPNLAALRQLAAAQQRMRAVMERPDLTPQ
jgi:hypothetical protein